MTYCAETRPEIAKGLMEMKVLAGKTLLDKKKNISERLLAREKK